MAKMQLWGDDSSVKPAHEVTADLVLLRAEAKGGLAFGGIIKTALGRVGALPWNVELSAVEARLLRAHMNVEVD